MRSRLNISISHALSFHGEEDKGKDNEVSSKTHEYKSIDKMLRKIDFDNLPRCHR